jgi:CheY-like chemotaxis protein
MAAQNTIKMISIDDKTLTTDLDRAGYRKMGVYVRPAANYEECSRLLASGEKIDLIVINMDYKAVDAVNVTKHLKMQEAFRSIPIVITSVQTAAKVRNAALDAGADLFVEQPLPRQYFVEKLKQLLEHKTRTTERVGLHGEAKFRYGSAEQSCPIGDLSISGILLSTDVELESGTRLSLEFELPGNKKPIRVDGEVVRTIRFNSKHPERAAGIGIRFVQFHGDSEKRLEKYIEKSAHGDAEMAYYL